MLRNLLAPVAILLASTTLFGWFYVNYLYKGERRRKPGKHRFDEHCVTMMWATVKPTPDKATWWQVQINGRRPLEAGAL